LRNETKQFRGVGFASLDPTQLLGVITWNDEFDIAPETLYNDATGEPLPAWMETESPVRSEDTPAPSVETF